MPASLSTNESIFLGTVLEALFYGVYCILFALHLNTRRNSERNRLTYPLVALFLLGTSYMCIDFTQQFLLLFRSTDPSSGPVVVGLNVARSMIYTFVDFTAQCVLIYRCWIMWDQNTLVIVFPSILALASFATCLTVIGELIIVGLVAPVPVWFYPLGVASFSISVLVNAIVTGLLVLKLVLMHRELMNDGSVGHGASVIRSLIAVLIESGMFTFVAQVAWTVCFGLQDVGFNILISPTTMIYGITPTIIIVRVALGRAFEPKTLNMVSTLKFQTKPGQGASSGVLSSGDISEKTVAGVAVGSREAFNETV